MPKLGLISLGCAKNLVDSEHMLSLMRDAGWEITEDMSEADVGVVNTCGFIEAAKTEAIETILETAQYKQTGSMKGLVVTGCLVQRYADEMRSELPEIDVLCGTGSYDNIVDAANAALKGQQAAYMADMTAAALDGGRSRLTPSYTAYFKIAEGCSNTCAYCIIPYTRGRVRSRRPEEVVAEVRELAAAGYQEVVLTGIHLSSYGVDFKEEENENLLSLIRQVHEVEGIRRIRLGSLEPRIITDDFAKALASMPKFCPHFHLSLQSGCDETLKRMNRHYTTEEYAAGCDILRRYFDNPAITTDVIVGFPGETEEEFEATKAFLERIGFYEMHIFKYSRRAGTRADRMPEQVPEQIKNVRSEALLLLEKQMSKAYRESFLGKKKTVLLEEKTEIGGRAYMIGHTMEYVKAVVPYADDLKNKMTEGVLKEALNDEVLLLDESWKVV